MGATTTPLEAFGDPFRFPELFGDGSFGYWC
jgi:hypothetical protein